MNWSSDSQSPTPLPDDFSGSGTSGGQARADAEPASPSRVGRIVAAWAALVALVLAAARLFSLFVLGFLDVVGVLTILCFFGVGLWWSVTGRHLKRWAGAVLATLAGLGAVAAMVAFVLEWPRQLLSLGAFLLMFGFFSARAVGIGSPLSRWRQDRVTLPASAREPSSVLNQVTVPAGLIINERSGGGKAKEIRLAERANAMGIDVEVLGKDDDLTAIAEQLISSGVEIIGMAGGDGSLGLVASVAMRHAARFVCIPVGTRNHFARDLGLDRTDPLTALTAYYGHEISVDVGRINGQTFLNNVSFGVYADLVHDPSYRDAKIETGQALVSELVSGERQPCPLHFAGPDGQRFSSAFVVLAAVGQYEMATLSDLGVRASLESGVLQISVLEPHDERQLRRLTAAAVLGTLESQDGFWQWDATELEIASPLGEVHAGVDGEALTFGSPARISLQPRALRVMVPDSVTPVPGPQSKPLSATVADLFRLAMGESDD